MENGKQLTVEEKKAPPNHSISKEAKNEPTVKFSIIFLKRNH